MKFSISLPTGFEGVMYPIPFVDPADFVRLAQLCERLGYHSVWGNDHITTQDYVRGLVAKRGLVPESPPVEAEAWPWPIKILTLGRFEVLRDGEPVRFARKVQRAPVLRSTNGKLAVPGPVTRSRAPIRSR